MSNHRHRRPRRTVNLQLADCEDSSILQANSTATYRMPSQFPIPGQSRTHRINSRSAGGPVNRVAKPAATAAPSLVLLVVSLAGVGATSDDQPDPQRVASLKRLTLEALGNIEVTTVRKEPEPLWRTPSALYVISQADIRRSGDHEPRRSLRLAPGCRRRPNRFESLVGWRTPVWRSILGVGPGADRRPKRIYPALRGRLLGGPGHVARRCRPHRGDSGTRRRDLGRQLLNGVINIITKSASDTSGVLASVGGGNVDHAIGGFRYGGGNGRVRLPAVREELRPRPAVPHRRRGLRRCYK